jgi:hypothetical protein
LSVRILVGDMRARLRDLPDNSVDSVVCDPPYHLIAGGFNLRTMTKNGDGTDRTKQANFKKGGFMGMKWDGGDVAFDPETWAEVLRVLKPGGHMLAFSGTRTYHRMAVAIEDAGFEVRDMIAWHYGSGFPKSLDVSKAIDKAAGAEREVVGERDRYRDGKQRQNLGATGGEFLGLPNGVASITAPATDAAREWEGYGTALKPATEPICLARKPLSEKSVAANVLKWGTGAINVDGCRIGMMTPEEVARSGMSTKADGWGMKPKSWAEQGREPQGRWPANLILSYPEDEYRLKATATAAQRRELFGWLSENA